MEAKTQKTYKMGASGKISESAPDQAVAKYGAALSITLAYMGDKLGLFKAMAFKGAMYSDEVALSCNLNEPVVKDWLINTAAEGYLEYDPESDRFELPDENAIALKDESSLLYIAGGLKVVNGMKRADAYIKQSFLEDKAEEAGAHQNSWLSEAHQISKPDFIQEHFNIWLSAIPGLIEKLDAGIRVADVGCSHGSSTLVMATAFPNSYFTGFEPHTYSVDRGNMMAKQRIIKNVQFCASPAECFKGSEYDLVTFFNCLHEVVRPVDTFKHLYEVLKPDGVIMVREHLAGYISEKSFAPLKRMFKGASVLHCLLDGTGDPIINEVDGKDGLERISKEAGFSYYRRAVDTEFERVLEIRR